MFIKYLIQWLENRSIISSASQESIQPDIMDDHSKENAKRTVLQKVVIPEKFKEDIHKLFEFIGQDVESSCFSDLCITLSLQEALTLMPRDRKRAYAYNPLVRYLRDETGITLNIVSQKSKKS